ncbi:MAG: stage II sporulation protein M [Candidatus Bathyarchaeota archaeon]|nr:stage II sporulation protein M [Candidatus Bathyarchaeota archaeon]
MEEKPYPTRFLSLKVILAFITLCFGFSALLGYFYDGGVAKVLEEVLREIFGASGPGKINPFFLTLFILVNNAVKCLLVIPLGVLLVVPPVVFITFNGFLLGALTHLTIKKLGEAGFFYILAAITPHGIFEIPAVFLSSALSVRVGLTVLLKLKGKNVSVGSEVKKGLKMYVYKILPLLTIAAVIEAFITPTIISTFFPT